MIKKHTKWTWISCFSSLFSIHFIKKPINKVTTENCQKEPSINGFCIWTKLCTAVSKKIDERNNSKNKTHKRYHIWSNLLTCPINTPNSQWRVQVLIHQPTIRPIIFKQHNIVQTFLAYVRRKLKPLFQRTGFFKEGVFFVCCWEFHLTLIR